MAKLRTLLDQIDSGTLLLPEFQRGYVWNRDQVRGLMRSLYRGFPVGGLLLWETDVDPTTVRGGGGGGVRLLLLDGQQRITSLYGVCTGHAPKFFQGNPDAFTGLYFDVEEEMFEFYAPAKMSDNPHWVSVTELFVEGLEPYFARFAAEPERAGQYLTRLNTLRQILERDFHEEKITGKDMTVDVVVDIFDRVNSGGTKLSKGDVALAKLCAGSSDIRASMRAHLDKWRDVGFSFTLDWLLRNATAVAKGRVEFSTLKDVGPAEFHTALDSTAGYIGTMLDALSGRLGLDHDRVLMGRGGMPVVSRLLHVSGGQFRDTAQREKTLFWYIHSALWGRHAGSTETVLAGDYDTAERDGIDGLIASLERWRGGNLDIRPHDFEGSTLGSRFYPLLYLLTRVHAARDLGTGIELHAAMLGKLTSLQVHHIFPKALLRQHGYQHGIVNAIANFCFLTQDSNLVIGKRSPAEYLDEAERRHPGVLASQWIPTDPALWETERYPDFLAARRELLATAAQSFLQDLRSGTAGHSRPVGASRPASVVVDDSGDARAVQVKQLVEELVAAGCAEPALDSEIADPSTGRVLCVAEAYWPDGLQPGQGQPVILELDPEEADLPRLEELGCKVFTSADALRGYVSRRNDEAAGDTPTPPEPAPPTEPTSSLVDDFNSDMRAIYDRARSEAHYTATYFLSMLAEHGGLATARKLLHAPAISDGFANLWERRRLDLTVEALVTQPRYVELFTPEEVSTARYRLEQFGYI